MTVTKLVIQEDKVLKLILEFLSSRKLYKTARTLEKETSVVNSPYSDNITFIRELVLDGEWEALEEYAQPLVDIHEFDCRTFLFLVTRQKYLEVLFEKCEGNVNAKDEHVLRDRLVSSLNLLKKYCSQNEYNKLYWYLSVPSLRKEPEFMGWSVDLSRMVLFEEILTLLKPFVPFQEQSTTKDVAFGDRLLGLVSKGLLYENCIEFCQKQALCKANDVDFSFANIRTAIFQVQSPESTGNFYSWLHNISPESFLVPFEELSIDVCLEKQRPESSRHDMKKNLLTKSLTFDSKPAARIFNNEHRHVQRENEKDQPHVRRTKHSQQVDFNGRGVSQSWADFKFPSSVNKRTYLKNPSIRHDYLDESPEDKEVQDECDVAVHSKLIPDNLNGKSSAVFQDGHTGTMMQPKSAIANEKASSLTMHHDHQPGTLAQSKRKITANNEGRQTSPRISCDNQVSTLAQSKRNTLDNNHDYHDSNMLTLNNDRLGILLLPNSDSVTKDHNDHHLPLSPDNYTGKTTIVLPKGDIKSSHENKVDSTCIPGKSQEDLASSSMVIESPRKSMQAQQELVTRRLEEHKKKQQEIHQQLAEMTSNLAKEDHNSELPKDGEWLNNIKPAVIPGEISSRKSFEALRKSEESFRFLYRSPTSATAELPKSRPQELTFGKDTNNENEAPKSTSSNSEPKTPLNNCLPPGLVKLADGSGTFNTSTPKCPRQAFMTPPPPASPVALEQKATIDEVPLKHSGQKNVIGKEHSRKPREDRFGQTPKRAVSGTKQTVVRTLVNDITRENAKPLSTSDETYAVKRSEPLNPAAEDMKFQKVAVLSDTQAIRSVAFHPSGNSFAVGTNSKSLKVCSFRNPDVNPHLRSDPPQPEILFKKTPIHKGSVYCIAFSPRGDIIATGSNDKLIKLIKFAEGGVENLQQEMELAIHSATVRDLVFFNSSSSHPVLASGGAGGGLIYVSDCTTGQTISSLQGHSGNIMTLFARSSENLLCSGSADKSVRLWDLRMAQCVDVVHSSSCVASVCFNYGTGPVHLASAHENGQCVIYDISARKPFATFQPHTMDCRTIRYSPDSRYILTGSYDASIVLTRAPQHDADQKLPSHVVARHRDKVIQCRWHPSIYSFVSSSADKTVALWKLEGR